MLLPATKTDHVQLLDLTSKSPTRYHVRMRPPAMVTTIVVHQMGFSWADTNPMWPQVKAHFAVQQSGTVLKLHDPLMRLRYGSGVANPYCVSVENEGNYPSARGQWFKPEKFGAHELADYPAQVHAARELITSLVQQLPSITNITAHRTVQGTKSNCCGPALYREVVMWAVREHGLVESTHLITGLSIPDTWRGEPTI